MHVDLTAIRTDYARAGFSERDLDPSPMKQLEKWVDEAVVAQHPEPTAMTLATVTAAGDPAARIVLLKGLDTRGLVFYTGYESDKGQQLAKSPRACACFFWVLLEWQARVSGSVVKVDRAESEAYFASRARASQLGAWASDQSREMLQRHDLERRVAEVAARFEGTSVPRPPYWSGFRVVPDRIEFWHSKPGRLHERTVYQRDGDGWRVTSLYP